jgi:DNA polymerase III alpha subunit
VCIAEGYVLGDQRRPKTFTEEQYFKTQAEMASCSPICRKRWRTASRSPAAAI